MENKNKIIIAIISAILILSGLLFGIKLQNNSVPNPSNACPPEVSAGESNIRVGAFNIQIFGENKMSKNDIMEVLAKIAQEYDVILLTFHI